jgi:hypothetical protein
MFLNYLTKHANLSSGAMETGDHFKNGASPKSQTSRGNFLSWGLALLLCVCAVFSSCSKDDDESGNDNHFLVGKWEAINSDIQKDDGSWKLSYTYEPGECIWVFDEAHLLIQDESDLMNGQKVPYSYNASKKELRVEGFFSNVLKLTQSELELESRIIEIDEDETGATTTTITIQKIVFKKIS